MCDPRVSSAEARRLDLNQFLPARIEPGEPGQRDPVLRCSGELDGAVAGRLAEALDSICGGEVESLLLDFTEVGFVDGCILTLIEQTRVRLERAGASLLVRAGGQPLRLLRLTGMGNLDAEAAPRVEAWAAPSSSFNFRTPTSGPPGVAMIR